MPQVFIPYTYYANNYYTSLYRQYTLYGLISYASHYRKTGF
ncbi:hypothetical protein LSH36_195g04035 [Paralvinella palmiformis]|uniref:Uncharacterized protein n=1 Tax=Paralvinella palmiformis TaxID=53620 RepID=A0AAD9N7R7_9ANNE|nr:hypothetical protein LSH36_195g04035 [Paralvinella palmiformis]